jgi:hypothetical protein
MADRNYRMESEMPAMEDDVLFEISIQEWALKDYLSNSILEYYSSSDYNELKSNAEVMAAFEVLKKNVVQFKIDRAYTYKDFLKSYYWHIVSRYYKIFIRNTCALCGSNKKLNVHHSAYKDITEETVFGYEVESIGKSNDILVTLCNVCHSKHHGVK